MELSRPPIPILSNHISTSIPSHVLQATTAPEPFLPHNRAMFTPNQPMQVMGGRVGGKNGVSCESVKTSPGATSPLL